MATRRSTAGIERLTLDLEKGDAFSPVSRTGSLGIPGDRLSRAGLPGHDTEKYRPSSPVLRTGSPKIPGDRLSRHFRSDFDLQRLSTLSPVSRTESPVTVGERQPRLSRRMSRTRARSQNFSRPSPPSSLGSIQYDASSGRRRSSSDSGERPHLKRAISPQEMPASPVKVRASFPSFAQRAIDTSMLEMHAPPPVFASPAYSQSSRSVDVIEAAKQYPFPDQGTKSTQRLLERSKERPATEPPSTFARWVYQAGKDDLLRDENKSGWLQKATEGVLDLTVLQRMHKEALRHKLVQQVKAMGDSGALGCSREVRATLHEYCDVVRDLEYMDNCVSDKRSVNPFVLSTRHPMDRRLLEEVGIAIGNPNKRLPQMGVEKLEGSRAVSRTQRRMKRTLFSVAGGLAILAPFLVMLLIQSSTQMVRMVAACAFTIVFALALSLSSSMESDRVGLAAAAYGAALIIFVGTSPAPYSYR